MDLRISLIMKVLVGAFNKEKARPSPYFSGKCEISRNPIALTPLLFTLYVTKPLLTSAAALTETRRLEPGTEYSVVVELDAVGYTLPAGDSLLLLVAPGSWPTVWPSPRATSLAVCGGRVTLPACTTLDTGNPATMFARPDMVPRQDHILYMYIYFVKYLFYIFLCPPGWARVRMWKYCVRTPSVVT